MSSSRIVQTLQSVAGSAMQVAVAFLTSVAYAGSAGAEGRALEEHEEEAISTMSPPVTPRFFDTRLTYDAVELPQQRGERSEGMSFLA